jgi:hypothetical protein
MFLRKQEDKEILKVKTRPLPKENISFSMA